MMLVVQQHQSHQRLLAARKVDPGSQNCPCAERRFLIRHQQPQHQAHSRRSPISTESHHEIGLQTGRCSALTHHAACHHPRAPPSTCTQPCLTKLSSVKAEFKPIVEKKSLYSAANIVIGKEAADRVTAIRECDSALTCHQRHIL